MRFINDIIKPFISTARVTLVVLGLLLSLFVNAQGWEKYYGDSSDEEAAAIIQTIDQGYAIAGRKSTSQNDFEIYILRLDVDGTVLWEGTYGTIDFTPDFGYDIVETADQSLVVIGETLGGGPFNGRDIYLLKVNNKGEEQWKKFFGTDNDDRGLGIQVTQDGGFIIVGESNDNLYLVKTDAEGELEWESVLAPPMVPQNTVGRAVVQTPGGDYIIAGSTGENDESDVYLARVNNVGQFLADETIGSNGENDVAHDIINVAADAYVVVGKTGNTGNFYAMRFNDSGIMFDFDWIVDYGSDDITEEARSVVQTKDNGFILAGFSDNPPPNFLQASLLKIDSNGDSLWTKNYGNTGLDGANDLLLTSTGELVFTGFRTESVLSLIPDVLVIKSDMEGARVFTNHITGRVVYDDDNCIYDGNETGIKDWTVKATGADDTYYAVTDASGNYDIPVPAGSYTVSVVTPNAYWLPCFLQNVNFPAGYETLERNFPVSPETACEDLEIDVSTSFIKACEQATYSINYCNHGTIEAEGIQVGLILDKNLEYISGPPFMNLIDSLYIFDVEDLEIGACGSFSITVEASCDALLSETHCIKANITPDNNCLPADPNWDGSSIAVNGYCDEDSVRFQIKNIGNSAMDQSLNYIVVEDIIMGLYDDPNPPTLAAGATHEIAIPANGATQRLIVQQTEGHPGNSISPTIAIEGCVAGGGTDYSTGYHTQFPEDDKDHFLATDCQENIPSTFDSRVKRGYPKGYGDSLKIASTTDLKYHIKFQNVGTDTAIRVVIRDTISPLLDPQTVRPGASSHDYEFEVYDNGILKFTFNDIMLIDSSTNEGASHGFVKYRITQKPDNPEGSIIKNGAAIFFDYNAPLTTDSVCNIIGGMEWTDFIITSDHNIYIPQTEIKIYPNPVSQFATFELEGPSIDPPLDFEVYDIAGRLVRSERFYQNRFIFYRKDLPGGMYFYRISSRNQLISTGKVIAK